MKKFFFAIGLMAIFLFSSCVTFKAEGLSYTTETDGFSVVGKFSVRKTVHELFGTPAGANLFNISSSAMSDKIYAIVSQEVQKAGGNGARNISITYSAGPLAYIANSITCGIWAPASLKIKGEIIKTESNTASAETEKAVEVAVAEFK